MKTKAIGSLTNIGQHKILFPMVYVVGFARETNPSFIPWSRDAFFEGH